MTRSEAWALAACVATLVGLAWVDRNVTDDAFIYFRYAEHFANGHGLVWNVGERVDGATCFLWVLLLGLAMTVGLPPVPVAFALGLATFAGSLVLFHRIARRVLGGWPAALVGVVLLGTNLSFAMAATGGLGTHLQTLCLLGCLALLVRIEGTHEGATIRLAGLSLVASLALLTRLDSALAVGPILAAALWVRRRDGGASAREIAALVGPVAVIMTIWAVWHWRYYGGVLPNTFYVKVAGMTAIASGLYYLYAFHLSYLLLPHVAIVGSALVAQRRAIPLAIGVSAVIVLSWWAYMVRIGGDFIEFRMLAPSWPFFLLLVCWALATAIERPAVRWALIGLVVVGSVHHRLAFGSTIFANCIYRPRLAFLEVPADPVRAPTLWSEREIGEYLGRVFAYDRSVTIGVGAAGMIPYASKLGAIDIVGLSDAWVPLHGTPLQFSACIGGLMPGHVRLATVAYMVERDVHLFIGPGVLTRDDHVAAIRSIGDLLTEMFLGDPTLARSTRIRGADFPAGAVVVEIGVRPGYKLLGVYLTRSPHVDAVIAAQGWRTYPVHALEDR